MTDYDRGVLSETIVRLKGVIRFFERMRTTDPVLPVDIEMYLGVLEDTHDFLSWYRHGELINKGV